MRCAILYFFMITMLLVSGFAHAEKNAILLNINGAISPAIQDYILRSLNYARESNAELVILQLDTPGGLSTSMRGINKAIIASPIPIVTYVAPEGARAASAGTFILYASHIAAMAPGTNLGAASPVSIGLFSSEKNDTSSTSEKKAMNDAAAYIRSLAQMRNRNAAWAEQAVRQAVSLSANEALKIKVIDLIAKDIPDLLNQINNKTVLIEGKNVTLKTDKLEIKSIKPDWRFQFLSIITDPSIAYILMLIGIYGLFFEFYNPGLVLPGVAGAISLLLALYAFQLLPVNYAGFGLLLLGIIFIITDVMFSNIVVLGIGGIIAFVIGSIFLLDTNAPGFNIAWQLILTMALVSGLFFFTVINLVLLSRRKKVVSGKEALIGAEGIVLEFHDKQGLVRVQGEIWQAQSEHALQPGQKIKVVNIKGLVLFVEEM